MKVYYAHFMGIYDTFQEERDLTTLSLLGFEIVNPNTRETSDKFNKLLKSGIEYSVAFDMIFNQMVRECEIFAFRATPDNKITSGVVMELVEAKKNNKIIIELPSAISQRSLSVDATKEYLSELGKR
jgi:Leu/Phe-tRNA-protein transferase